jgi:hypothetical protein
MARGSCLENVQLLYKNIEERYVKHIDPPDQFWNAHEFGAQVGCNGGAFVFASCGVRQVHTTTPDEHEHHLI